MSDDFLGHYLSGRKVAIIVRFLYLGNHFLLNVLSISPGRYCHLFTKMYRERRSSVYVVYKRKRKNQRKQDKQTNLMPQFRSCSKVNLNLKR